MYNFFKYLLVAPAARYLFGTRIEGAENIPESGGAILASNHLAAGDTFLLPAMIRRRLTFPAKAELFRGDRGLGSKVVAWFMKGIGQVPLERGGGRASLEGLGPVLQVLADGGLVGIYPEGTRSPDGRLFKGKTGVARLALASGCPVIPVGAINTQFVKNRLGMTTIRKPVIRIGKPLDFSAYAELANDRATIRWITDEVMNAIRGLTGQTYVDGYGTSVKSGAMSLDEAKSRELPRPGGGPAPKLPLATGGAG